MNTDTKHKNIYTKKIIIANNIVIKGTRNTL